MNSSVDSWNLRSLRNSLRKKKKKRRGLRRSHLHKEPKIVLQKRKKMNSVVIHS